DVELRVNERNFLYSQWPVVRIPRDVRDSTDFDANSAQQYLYVDVYRTWWPSSCLYDRFRHPEPTAPDIDSHREPSQCHERRKQHAHLVVRQCKFLQFERRVVGCSGGSW